MVSFKERHGGADLHSFRMNGRRGGVFTVSVFLLLLGTVIFTYTQGTSGQLRKCVVKIYRSSGGEASVNAEIASTDRERERGLMYRESLPENSGMLFVFEKDRRLSFWMKNTYIPLDIAFINSKGVITDIHQMRPLDTSVFYSSSGDARYALEVNRGWFGKNGITIGDKTGLNGCIGK